MKLRVDFITNSSSSSFVIMTKEELSNSELEKEIELAFNPMASSSMFPNMGKQIASVLVNNSKQITVDYFLDDMGYETIEELKSSGFVEKNIYENYKEYPFIQYGFVSNETDDSIEYLLCDIDIIYKNDKIIVTKVGGY